MPHSDVYHTLSAGFAGASCSPQGLSSTGFIEMSLSLEVLMLPVSWRITVELSWVYQLSHP